MNEQMKKFNQYNEKEIEQLLNDKVKLVYIDTDTDEIVARYEDLPDIIVDINDKFGHCIDLKVYDIENLIQDKPILTTFGPFLNKCDSNVRSDIIDRLTKLQQNEIEVKDYKIIDEELFNDVKIAMEQKAMER